MSTRVTRQYGPFRSGYVASRKRWQAPLDSITADSKDWLVDPVEAKLVRRRGGMLVGQFVKDANEVTVQFESGPTYGDLYARQIIDLESSAITDGAATHGILYSGADAGFLLWMSPNSFTVAGCSGTAGSTTVTTSTANGFEDVTVGMRVAGYEGGISPGDHISQVTTINSTTSIEVSVEPDSNFGPSTLTLGGTRHGLNLNIGRRFGTGRTPARFRMVPVIGVSNRCKAAAERAKIALGSRHVVSVGDHIFIGNGSSGNLPLRWFRDWNDRLSSGSRTERVYPLGHMPPLVMNVVTGSQEAVGPTFNWKTGRTYFFSLMYRYKDGSHSKPFIPRYKAPIVANSQFFGYFEVTVDCDDLTITIPVGPADVAARLILRTTAGTVAVPPPLVDPEGNSLLGIAAVIENNTETSFNLRAGNDLDLAFDPAIVRLDHVWPPPTRYLWTGDHRLWGGGLEPNAAAIILAPRVTVGEAGTTIQYHVEVTASQVGLSNYDALDALSGFVNLSISSTKTLEQLVDDINAAQMSATTGGGTLYWAAQLAPGADPGARSDQLALTGTTDFGDVANGLVRAFSPALPVVLLMNSTYLAAQPSRPRRLWFSMGGPGGPQGPSPAMSVKNFRDAPESWGFLQGGAALGEGNRGQVVCFSKAIGLCINRHQDGLDDSFSQLEPINESRGCISDASIVAGNGWVGYLTMDGYVVTDGTREVLISGALYNPATGEGVMRRIINRCLMNNLASNAGVSAARWGAAGLDGSRLILNVNDTEEPDDRALFQAVYDFSAGTPASGLAEVLQPNETPWPWSAPLNLAPDFLGVDVGLLVGTISRRKLGTGTATPAIDDTVVGRQTIGAMPYLSSSQPTVPKGMIARLFDFANADDGTTAYAGDFTHLSNDGTSTTATTINGNATITLASADSRISVGALVIELVGSNLRRGSRVTAVSGTAVTLTRNAKANGTSTVIFLGKTIQPRAYLATDLVDNLRMKALHGAWAFYNQAGTGMRVELANELDRTGAVSFALPAVATADGWSRQKLNPTQALRGLAKAIEGSVVDAGTATLVSEYWGLEADIEVLDSHR